MWSLGSRSSGSKRSKCSNLILWNTCVRERAEDVLVSSRKNEATCTGNFGPADNGFLRIDTLRKLKHCAVIVHIDGDLLASLRMQHRECGTDRDCTIALASRAEKGTDNALLGTCAA